jgi:hypothetical protein
MSYDLWRIVLIYKYIEILFNRKGRKDCAKFVRVFGLYFRRDDTNI